MKNKMEEVKRTFVVVMRAPSAVVFWQGENLQINGFETSVGPVKITYATRWIKKTDKIVIPGQLWIEVQGEGDSLDDVLIPFANAALMAVPLLAFSANAAVEEAEIEIAFESTPGAISRDYFQSYIAPESGVVHVGRRIDINATVALLDSVNKNSESERILRAINQYRLSLSSWRMGNESLSLSHLWMALEAITKAVLRTELVKHCCESEAKLAEKYGVEIKELDSYVRKELILKGDAECYKKGKKASDGFEHGFLGFEIIRDYAKDIRHRMADYIRLAIFDLLAPLDKQLEVILRTPFDKPMGHWPVVKYLRGKLVGESDVLAKNGNAYPFMKWNPVISACSPEDNGKVTYQFSESISPELADGIGFQATSFEAWQPD